MQLMSATDLCQVQIGPDLLGAKSKTFFFHILHLDKSFMYHNLALISEMLRQSDYFYDKMHGKTRNFIRLCRNQSCDM